ncbi:MAG: transaldolase [Acidimicrobiaceae bacterium]|nr:transaldolase [Acidimicrobiaceae bacterium]MBO0886773.1 transaldolase [Acidimicrobiales bacterium]
MKIFADGASLDQMLELAEVPHISGFTTNPTLMRGSGVSDYTTFARRVLGVIADKPVSFEVFSDDQDEMERQARTIASWAENVYVKIPVTTTTGESTAKLAARLTSAGIKLNITAILSLAQVRTSVEALEGTTAGIVSVFAGRIADTGRDPIPIMAAALELVSLDPSVELLWASPREVLNLVQADAIGCHIITMTPDLLKKLPGLGRGLEDLSLDTVRMFHEDARAAGYSL